MNLQERMLSNKPWVVIGVTPNQARFGYKIPVLMYERGYEITGLNPKYQGQDIFNFPVVGSPKELPSGIKCANVVVSPPIILSMLEELYQSGVRYLWFQPGSFDEHVLDRAQELGFETVVDCVYAVLKNLP